MPDLAWERACLLDTGGLAAGLDEVGRGALAGPVVAAAVVLDPADRTADALGAVDDSKRLSPALRHVVAQNIRDSALDWGLGQASVDEIDALGIGRANDLAMLRALAALRRLPVHLLVDGYRLRMSALPQQGIVGGDHLVLSIAAASVLAKVHRDGLMLDLDGDHPGYGFAQHMGYGTAAHRRAIASRGPSSAHRLSWRLLDSDARTSPRARRTSGADSAAAQPLLAGLA
ncbi:MAG: ribonuclease HII [Ardenticatenia bacterium]|nr:ribonuclease HII [Ardenticatenia bacterium]